MSESLQPSKSLLSPAARKRLAIPNFVILFKDGDFIEVKAGNILKALKVVEKRGYPIADTTAAFNGVAAGLPWGHVPRSGNWSFHVLNEKQRLLLADKVLKAPLEVRVSEANP